MPHYTSAVTKNYVYNLFKSIFIISFAERKAEKF